MKDSCKNICGAQLIYKREGAAPIHDWRKVNQNFWPKVVFLFVFIFFTAFLIVGIGFFSSVSSSSTAAVAPQILRTMELELDKALDEDSDSNLGLETRNFTDIISAATEDEDESHDIDFHSIEYNPGNKMIGEDSDLISKLRSKSKPRSRSRLYSHKSVEELGKEVSVNEKEKQKEKAEQQMEQQKELQAKQFSWKNYTAKSIDREIESNPPNAIEIVSEKVGAKENLWDAARSSASAQNLNTSTYTPTSYFFQYGKSAEEGEDRVDPVEKKIFSALGLPDSSPHQKKQSQIWKSSSAVALGTCI